MTADDSWVIIDISDIRLSPRVDFLMHARTLWLTMLNMLQYGGNMLFDLILLLLWVDFRLSVKPQNGYSD